eukprot:gene22850-27617_t
MDENQYFIGVYNVDLFLSNVYTYQRARVSAMKAGATSGATCNYNGLNSDDLSKRYFRLEAVFDYQQFADIDAFRSRHNYHHRLLE